MDKLDKSIDDVVNEALGDVDQQIFNGKKETPAVSRGWFYRLRFFISKLLINLAVKVSPDALYEETNCDY